MWLPVCGADWINGLGLQDLEPIMCTREKPQGTETLPPDIIDVSTDLFPRRLWGVPEEVCFVLRS
jgi:hypothetical protein